MAQWAPYCVGSGYSRYPFDSQPRDRHNVAGDNVASQQLNSGGLEWFRGKHVKLAHFSSLSAMSYAYLLSDRFVGEPENCTEESFALNSLGAKLNSLHHSSLCVSFAMTYLMHTHFQVLSKGRDFALYPSILETL